MNMINVKLYIASILTACTLSLVGCKEQAADTSTATDTPTAQPAATQQAAAKAATPPPAAAPEKTPFPADYKAENEGWLVDVDKAYNLSKETGKPILANFTGSDWCGWCKRLTRSVFVKDDFKKWADDNVVLLELDFPKRKQLPAVVRAQNQNLQRAFQVRGYPTIWLFDLNKNASGQFDIAALGKTGYKKTVGEFTGELEQYLAKR